MPVKDYVIDLSNELGFSQTGEVVRAERKLVTESLHKRVQKPSTAQPIGPTRVTKMESRDRESPPCVPETAVKLWEEEEEELPAWVPSQHAAATYCLDEATIAPATCDTARWKPKPEQAAWSAASTDTQPPLLPPLLQ
ncbi:hypothetical protein M422DRAFT_277036 [Sphaerobolus stellatus SS14]|uniref:Uncharacterized protein n=1 Tax=Sphaerobolus stellatus (strain SS14) TaxID=990650 RepID=A0A0C9UBN8_SPHS4|nr:hypothetical protein M422DRAFT_277036 [Sphaerobolus stellatus SS14]